MVRLKRLCFYLISCGLFFLSAMQVCAMSGRLGGVQLQHIKRYFLHPAHTYASYKAILEGIADKNRHYRFFAVQAGLAIPVLANSALQVALRDNDPAILNLGLAALEKKYDKKYSPILVSMVLRVGNSGLSAFMMLQKYDVPILQRRIVILFLKSGRMIQNSLLDMIEKKELVIGDKQLFCLAKQVNFVLARRLLEILAARGSYALLPDLFGSWSLQKQNQFIEWMQQKPDLLQQESIVALLDKTVTRNVRQRIYRLLLDNHNLGLMRWIGRKLLAQKKLHRACLYAKDLLRYSHKVVLNSYAQAVLRLKRCLIMKTRLRVLAPKRKVSLRQMIAFMKLNKQGATATYIRTVRKKLTRYRLMKLLFVKGKQHIKKFLLSKLGKHFSAQFTLHLKQLFL